MKNNILNFKIIVIFSLFSAFYFSNANAFQNKAKKDTVFVRFIDASTKHPVPEYQLISIHNDQEKIVYIKKAEDYSSELEFNFTYDSNGISYACFTIYHLITGIQQSIFFDKATKRFYITEYYDLEAVDDKIIKSSVSFNNMSAQVYSNNGIKIKQYSIKLKPINEDE